MQIHENTILITGGNSGIGLALAKGLAREGNRIIVCGRDEEELRQAESEIENCAAKRCDLNVPADRAELVRWTLENFPDLNVVVNNAGVLEATDLLADSFDFEKILEQLTVDLLAPIELTLRFLPHLRRQPRAALINVSSGTIYAPEAGAPMYAAAKVGVHAFTKSVRYQLRDQENVEIIEIMPPTVDTDFTAGFNLEKAGGAISPEETAEAIIKGLKNEDEEILIGQVKWLYIGSRVAPEFVNRKLNEAVAAARQSS